MKNKVLKITMVMLLIMLIITIITPRCLATIVPGDINGDIGDNSEIGKDFLDKILGLLRTIGIFIAVGGVMVIGIKYIVGSVEEKASYKKTMVPYLVGCIFLFGASTIAPIIVEMFKETTDVESVGNQILGVIQVVGTFIAVGALMILGIKYMVGSVEQRASYKKTMLPFVIGSVFLFSAVNVTAFVYNIVSAEGNQTISNAKRDAMNFAEGRSREEISKKRQFVQDQINSLDRVHFTETDDIEDLRVYWNTYLEVLDSYYKTASSSEQTTTPKPTSSQSDTSAGIREPTQAEKDKEQLNPSSSSSHGKDLR